MTEWNPTDDELRSIADHADRHPDSIPDPARVSDLARLVLRERACIAQQSVEFGETRRALMAAGARAEAERDRLKAEMDWRYPCDGLCGQEPAEDCSRHGRKPAELWALIGELVPERDQARAALARVEALCDTAVQAVLATGRPDSVVMAEVAKVRATVRVSDLRAAIARPADGGSDA